MGFFDNPDSAAARREQEAAARREAEAKAREKRKQQEKLEKQRREEKLELQRQQREEDERAIEEMAKKFLGDQSGKDDRKSQGLNRGPGLGAGIKYKNPNVQLGQGLAADGSLPPGFNPNAPRAGHEDECASARSGKGDSKSQSGVPKLPRPI